MKKITGLLLLAGMIFLLTSCAAPASEMASSQEPNAAPVLDEGDAAVRIRITVGETQLIAAMENNETAKALLRKMPMTLSMADLYGREMCYHYGADTLPVGETRSDGYEVGNLIYWPPKGSFVILYKQNGEKFERVPIGHIDAGTQVFEHTGDTDVTFEVIESERIQWLKSY